MMEQLRSIKDRFNRYTETHNIHTVLRVESQRRIVITAALVAALSIPTGFLGGFVIRSLFSAGNEERQASEINTLSAKGTEIAGLNTDLQAELSRMEAAKNKADKDLVACRNQPAPTNEPRPTNDEVSKLKDELDRIKGTKTVLEGENAKLKNTIYSLTSTELTPAQIINLFEGAKAEGDQEVIDWLISNGCIIPTETPNATSTRVFPTGTPTPTGTASPTYTHTPTSMPERTPEKPTDTPQLPTSTPKDTSTPKASPTLQGQTNTPFPTYTPDATATMFPTFTTEPSPTTRPTATIPPTPKASPTFQGQTATPIPLFQ